MSAIKTLAKETIISKTGIQERDVNSAFLFYYFPGA